MARTRGARNADYAEARLALARRVRDRVIADEGLTVSLRSLASAADTSVANLKHYFGDREGVFRGVMEVLHLDAAPHLAAAATPEAPGDVEASLRLFLKRFKMAWFQFGVGRMQAATLAAGLSTSTLGPSYLTHILEPLLQAFESFVTVHIDRRELRPCHARLAALEFISPVVFALLHQDTLSGAQCRPLDLDAFCEQHIQTFLRSFGPEPANLPARSR